MKISFGKVTLLMALVGAFVANAALTVRENDGVFQVLRDDTVIVDNIRMDMGKTAIGEIKTSFDTMPDGSLVWNRWCEERDTRFRIEVVQRADAAIEISMSSQVDAFHDERTRFLMGQVVGNVMEGDYEALESDGRKYRYEKGTFNDSYKSGYYRWVAVNGITFDFNPFGSADYCSGYNTGAVQGVWGVERKDGYYAISGGSNLRYICGGFVGAKLVIREGEFKDFDKYHLIKAYTYSQHLVSSNLVCFGAPEYGKLYADGNVAFTEKRGYGWVSTGNDGNKVNVGNKQGAFYSNVSGSGKATYRFANMPDGYYIFTISAGNYTGIDNQFTLDVNGDVLANDAVVPARKLRTFAKAVHISGGSALVNLSGNYLLSTIGIQPVMGDGEDFFISRGYWVKDGYEPASIYRNCDYAVPAVLRISDDTVDMPVPGMECNGKPRELQAPVKLPDPNSPELAWLKNVKLYKLFTNSATLAELEDPQVMKEYLDRETNGKNYTVTMISGMHSRHTYFSHLKRGQEAIGRIAQDLHSRNIKLIDHHDATLLWNVDAGLRVLMERQPELMRSINDNLPSFQFCPNNPVFKKTYFEYLRGLVANGVDGFQIDELEFWQHGCACRYCREGFKRDTGWDVPLNELDTTFSDGNSELRKRWLVWRYRTITNWFIELREYVEDLNPNLTLTVDTTHWGFTRSQPAYNVSSNLIDLARVMNWLATEVMTRNVMQTSRALMPLRKMKGLISVEYGTPIRGWFYSSNWKTNYFSWAMSNMLCQSAVLSEVKAEADTPDYEAFGGSDLNMNMDAATTECKVALLFSEQSRDWNSGIGFYGEIFGVAQALEALHVPYDFVGDISMRQEKLAKYKALFLGASGCLSDNEIYAIMQFAANGGTVHLSTIAGLYNELGMKRDKWPFEGIFGFSPLTAPVRTVKSCQLGANKPIDISLNSYLPKGSKENPEIIERAFGKGRFLYSSVPVASVLADNEATVGQAYSFNPDPKLDAAFRDFVKGIVGDAYYWKVNVPNMVFTTIWREKNGNLVVHFLNSTGTNIKPGEVMKADAPEPAYPLLENDIVFTISMPGCTAAIASSPDFKEPVNLQFSVNEDGLATVTLPKELLKAYTIVKLVR